MEELTVYQAAAVDPGRDITADLVQDFVDFIDRSKSTARAYLKNLRLFLEFLQARQVTRPGRADILLYRDYLEDTGHKPNTTAAYLQSIRQFFSWTAAVGIYPNIAANIRPPKIDRSGHRKEALRPAEVAQIETSIAAQGAAQVQAAAQACKDKAGRIQRSTEQSKRLYAMYLLAVTAGLRTIEISRANVGDLETRAGQTWLYIWGKGHAEPDTRKPLCPEAAAAIADYLATRADDPTAAAPLFVSTGNRSGGQRIAPTTISTMLKRAMQAAGIDSPRITAHSLRHTAGTAAQEISGDIYATQQYMRHASPKTTEIYLHNDTEKQEAAIAGDIYGYFHGGTNTGEGREKLERSLQRMNQAQINALAEIAAALTGV